VASGATSFTLPTPVAYTSSYAVQVQTQPGGQACSVSNGSGTMPASAVTNVKVTCSDQPFTLGGTITGLGNNTGLVLANGTDTLTVAAASTAFTMPTPVDYGDSYSIVVQSSPAGLTCTASNSSGTMPANNVTAVVVTCSDQAYILGGTLSGLTASGLVLANGADTINVPSGATSFQMDQAVAYTSAYDVVVQTQPTGLTCSVSNGSGAMPASDVGNVAVTCSTATYTVGGSIMGLSANGLVLLDNGGDATTINANAMQFTMNTGVAYGSGYAITVQTQPTGLICAVSHGAGTVGAGDVTSVSIVCTWSTTTLYSLAGGSGDGATPWAGLLQGSDGNFYGTTADAGASGYGTIFRVTASGAESLLYSFGGGTSDGATPLGALIQGNDGNFYGTTNIGGSGGYGTVFVITPSGTESVLYSFAGGSSDGANPWAGLTQGSDGNFYGTTTAGGANGEGTVFMITPSGAETVLYSFAGGSGDGAAPYGTLIQGSDGNFYGTTYSGGTSNLGTVFKITASGAETIVYSFAGGSSDGAHPWAGLVQGNDGNLYGTTLYGGPFGEGSLFRLTPSGTETVLHFFAGAGGDGAAPVASLLQASDGNFYGTTYTGGTTNQGTVFQLTLGGTETILYSFGAAGVGDGALPPGALIQGSDGNLYGTAQTGGADTFGTIFKVTLQ